VGRERPECGPIAIRAAETAGPTRFVGHDAPGIACQFDALRREVIKLRGLSKYSPGSIRRTTSAGLPVRLTIPPAPLARADEVIE
jgi:hypothetical protein